MSIKKLTVAAVAALGLSLGAYSASAGPLNEGAAFSSAKTPSTFTLVRGGEAWAVAAWATVAAVLAGAMGGGGFGGGMGGGHMGGMAMGGHMGGMQAAPG